MINAVYVDCTNPNRISKIWRRTFNSWCL